MTLDQLAQTAYQAMAQATRIGSVGGCGRVYVEITDDKYKSIRKGSKVAKAFEKAGFKMTARPFHTGVRIYIGYDNATGLEFDKGNRVAKALMESGLIEHGLKAYCDGDGD